MALLLLSTIFFALIILYIFNFYYNVSKLPSSPFPLPVIGNAHLFDPKNLHKWILKQRETYGSVFTVYISHPIVVLSDVKAIKEASSAENSEFFSGRKLGFPDALFQEVQNTGIGLSTGYMWQIQRRLTLTIMRNFGMGQSLMENKIIESRNELMDYLNTLEDKKNVDFGRIIHLTVGNIINSVIFGFMYSYDDAKDFYNFTKLVDDSILCTLRWEFRFLSMFPKLADYQFVKDYIFPSFFSHNKELRQINRERIQKAKESFRQDEEPQNLVNALFKEIYTEDSKYSCLNETHVNAIAFDMYLAGQETSTTTLKWLVVLLMKYPEMQQKIFEEISSTIGLENEIKLSHKNQLPFTMAFINETQRWANILPLVTNHLCTKDTAICGKLIPKGSVVQPFYYGSNYDEAVFEKPYEFIPERFLLEDGKTLNKKLYEQMFSFGKGGRVCAGQSLALSELQLIFPTLVQHYKFSPNGEIDMSTDFLSVIAPRKFTCKIAKRV
uniref:Cytochrome P450 n=1 Tax=Rhabditophanes sp. KR3021 TaxID=114890 RepID=A0AC35U2D4_9BILA